ncbi:enoyl-CoA hydratase/isomerase family protein [Sphingobium yanoikuyae]|uniref:enoyl-CoA hydratase/isomerase family protein n=1 Tax=Sphingobium yanoikuyae TaxID=13690 RepID=UPI000AA4FBF5|nr:enoyl-CoA hydratase/isomerase family protein [Sphingobium yanoikuyae]
MEVWEARLSDHYQKIRVAHASGVAIVTIDNPPVNVLDAALMTDLRRFLTGAREDHETKVIIFESASPDFFIAHVDMRLIDDPHAFDEIARDVPPGLNVFQALGELVRGLPQVTIVKLAGVARGGGAEFIAACDMAFAAIGRAGLGQIEALMGIVPSGGAMQYLSTRMSRGRILEVILGGGLFTAEEAAAYGWINRALPAAELDNFVDALARHIAALPAGVAPAAKRVLPPDDLSAGFVREQSEWSRLFAEPAAELLIRGGLARGAQTVDGEKRLEEILREIPL